MLNRDCKIKNQREKTEKAKNTTKKTKKYYNFCNSIKSQWLKIAKNINLKNKTKIAKKDQARLQVDNYKENAPELDKYVFKVSNLNIYYNNGDKQALKDININIERNKVTAFIGPSGCGKSTLLRTLNRMNDLLEGIKITGQVLFNDMNIYENKKQIITLRTKVGMVFQKPNPFPMSIYENVAYGPKNQGIRNHKILNQIVEDSLKKAALWDEVKNHLSDSALSLSGGQQQRLCIARAIALNPEVLLMDEPTSALDPIAANKIEDLIAKIKKEFTIILVTHSMQQAARVSSQTAFFLNGELIEFDQTKKIFSRPKNIKTENYITGRLA